MVAVRQKIEALFDYRGDNAKNADGVGPRTYSNDYSPNNIKRVVISPNGVLVVYHRAVIGTKSRSYGYVEFSERDLYMEEQAPKYKPILRLLADPLVCASIEEIVVLSKSLTGQVHQNYMNEIRLETMVASFKGEGADLKTRISNRFKRLRYYTVTDVNFKEFMNYFRSTTQSGELRKYPFFSEMPALKQRSNVTELAGSDYWKYYGCQTGSYSFDVQLQGYFKAIIQKHEADEKDKAVSELRDKRVGGKVKAINDMIEDCVACSRLWELYTNIVQKEGTNGVLPSLGFMKVYEPLQLFDFKGMAKVPEKFMSSQKVSEAEALEKDEAILKAYKARCCRALADNLLHGLSMLMQKPEEVLVKTLLTGCETTICVPPEVKPVADALSSEYNVTFQGRDLNASIINSCWQFMLFFVACEHTEPFTRDYWQGKLVRFAISSGTTSSMLAQRESMLRKGGLRL